ncbi:MAG: aminotransferase class I/II-fold pyridoxal phosphate-dependent enzyme, partial [Pseudomonadota bacterium]
MHEPLSWVSRGAREAPGSGIFDVVNYGRDKPGLIPLWAGEGDVPTPRFIVEAAQRGLADGETFYTHQRGIPPLREALAAYYERQFARPFDPESFYVTGSGMQAILICLQLTTGAGEEVLIPTPTWPNVAGAAIVKGATPVEVHMREESGAWTLEIEDLEAATTPMTRAIFVNSPANPSGWVASRETLQEILLFARRHRLWIIAD